MIDKLSQLEKEVSSCTMCDLHSTRTNVVFGEGKYNSDIVVVGEAPGKNEDLTGRPFVGRAGSLLNKIINSIGLDRNEIYILNTIRCRPPNNRNPTTIEIETCKPWLTKQLEIINPKIIVAVGRFAIEYFLGPIKSVNSCRGKIHEYNNYKIICMYHPAYLLRNIKNMDLWYKMWNDVKLIKDCFLGDK